MQKIYVMQNTHRTMRGFEYLVYSVFASVLLLVLILLPLAPVFANETEQPSEVAVEPVAPIPETTEQSEPAIPEVPTEEEVLIPTTSDIDATSENEEPTDEVSVGSDESEIAPEVEATEATSTEESDDVLDDETSSEDETSDQATSTTETSTTTEIEEISEEPIVVPDTPPEEELTEEASTTEPEVVVVATTTESSVSVNTLTNDNNIFSFSKSECVGVGDGSFYCTNATTSPLVAGMDRVFSAPDSDGDKEIYIEKGGVLTQITSNQLDDDAPHYDESSNSIVWHRLVNERYQIISYDVAEALEEQITNDRYNNMEPSRYGDITVWQGWVGNDWEIMLMEGDDISMITDNTTGDVSPRINGNYIIWQAFEDTAWRVKVYDRDTKEIDTIADADGASVDNPRLEIV